MHSGVDAAMALGAVDLSLPGLLPNVAAPTPGGISAGGSLAIAAGRDLTLGPAPVHAGRDHRKLPGQAVTSKVGSLSARWRYSAGVRSPSDSWGRCSL